MPLKSNLKANPVTLAPPRGSVPPDASTAGTSFMVHLEGQKVTFGPEEHWTRTWPKSSGNSDLPFSLSLTSCCQVPFPKMLLLRRHNSPQRHPMVVCCSSTKTTKTPTVPFCATHFTYLPQLGRRERRGLNVTLDTFTQFCKKT